MVGNQSHNFSQVISIRHSVRSRNIPDDTTACSKRAASLGGTVHPTGLIEWNCVHKLRKVLCIPCPTHIEPSGFYLRSLFQTWTCFLTQVFLGDCGNMTQNPSSFALSFIQKWNKHGNMVSIEILPAFTHTFIQIYIYIYIYIHIYICIKEKTNKWINSIYIYI